jgi:hypothetical protein
MLYARGSRIALTPARIPGRPVNTEKRQRRPQNRVRRTVGSGRSHATTLRVPRSLRPQAFSGDAEREGFARGVSTDRRAFGGGERGEPLGQRVANQLGAAVITPGSSSIEARTQPSSSGSNTTWSSMARAYAVFANRDTRPR